jgi:hypothetical protein
MTFTWYILQFAAMSFATSAEAATLFLPTGQGIKSERRVINDSDALVFDQVTIPLRGPGGVLVDDGSVQTFRVDLAPLQVLLSPGMSFYDISFFFPDDVFPLPGAAGPFKFWPDDAKDSVKLEGTGLTSQGIALSLQEYVRIFPGNEHRTEKLALFSGAPTSMVTAPPGTQARLDSLEFVLDIPTDVFNNPVVQLDRAAIRFLIDHPRMDRAAVATLPRAVVVIPEPACLLLAVVALFGCPLRKRIEPCSEITSRSAARRSS